jgi:hypothetical protein
VKASPHWTTRATKLLQSSVTNVVVGFAQDTHKTISGIRACSNLATKAAKAEPVLFGLAADSFNQRSGRAGRGAAD